MLEKYTGSDTNSEATFSEGIFPDPARVRHPTAEARVLSYVEGLAWRLRNQLGCRYESVLRLAVPQWKVTARSYRCLSRFVQQCIISTQEAADLLDCSRQNIDDLTKRGKLLPIKSSEKQTLYLKSEVLKRAWK